MKLQKYEQKSFQIREEFEKLKSEHPERVKRRIDLSFSSACFGLEPVTESIQRLAELGYQYIEIPGNYGGSYSGHHRNLQEILQTLDRYEMKCSGVCPLTMPGYSLTESDFFGKQRAAEYLIQNVLFCKALGGSYYLITAGPVGMGKPYDSGDYARSVELLRNIADVFVENNIKCAVEPCELGATPFCHNTTEAKQYISDVNHPGFQYIYGDLRHFLRGEAHLGEAIIGCGEQLLCMHLRDTCNQMAVGNGMVDLDTVIRALYLIGFNTEGHYAVGEPLPVGYMDTITGMNFFAPYPEKVCRQMAKETLEYFREREEEILK